jgi:hypothetical protein
MFEGTALEARLTPVTALLVTVLLTWGCATSTSVSTPADEEFAGIAVRLAEVVTRQTMLERHFEALREARPRFAVAEFSRPNNPLRKAVAALEPVLDHIESDLLAFQARHPEHQRVRDLMAYVEARRKVVHAWLAGETLPSRAPEPAVPCPGTSEWNGWGCTTRLLVYVEGEVRKPGAVKYTSGMTLTQGIAQAGGFACPASVLDIELIRGGKTRSFGLNSDPQLRPGDVIRVHARFI